MAVEDWRTEGAKYSGGMDPGAWLEGYFRTRAHLAGCESEFQCDPACTRPGCTNKLLLVPVSLMDLMGAARYRDEAVSETYRRHYTLGLIATEQNEWLRIMCLRLRKPCPFLKDDRCSIYPVRPLACILFPEYLAAEGRFEAEAGKDHFREFLCLQRHIRLSAPRAAVMGRLKRMWEREMLLSNHHLFSAGRGYIDFSNVIEELLQAARAFREANAAETAGPRETIPNRVMEQFLHGRMEGAPILGEVRAKIDNLDTEAGQAQFLQLGRDEELVKKLVRPRDDRELIFRFVKGGLQASRRSLLPAGYTCC